MRSNGHMLVQCHPVESHSPNRLHKTGYIEGPTKNILLHCIPYSIFKPSSAISRVGKLKKKWGVEKERKRKEEMEIWAAIN